MNCEHVITQSGMNPKYTDLFKASELLGASFSFPYNFPLFKASKLIPEKLIPFDKIFRAKKDDYGAFVHFFLQDVCFERFWRNPGKYIPQLKKFAGCIMPDFSLCYDFPYPLQLYNCYRNRVLGFIMSSNGIPVVMNASFGDARTFDFCTEGIPRGSVIATGSLGTMKNPEERELFLRGLGVILGKLAPSDLILFGTDSEDARGLCEEYGTILHVFTPRMGWQLIK